jgi:hypothetical protein
MARRTLDPNALPPAPKANPSDPPLLQNMARFEDLVRRALVDIWSIVGQMPLTITGNYTTTGAIAFERLVCTNSIPITVTLHDTPADGDRVSVKRQNAQVTIAGNGNTIDGEASLVLGVRYDAPHIVYTDSGSEWSIME